MKKEASAFWTGGLKDGKGTFSTQSGAIREVPYGFRTRFEGEVGSNPEELIAAAHASCFSMALASELQKRGVTPESVSTHASIDFLDLTLKKSQLTTKVTAKGASKETVEEAAQAAKEGCPISKVLKLEIALDLSIEV
jgi:osmotically inducible protein OsmC